ncbi:serine protease 3-like [Drosophila guanche]|uniref:Blast:Serine protease 3 n=1 Tax=Drosophila guanche TaxID=7266 RepID=A0A3B0KH72_DROGU|nr:serine protease 3-like [Drosophila guanche]SPP85086.1 blast:Serine protease 3 [Drosophila guanche]
MVILWCLLVAQLFIVGESNQLLRIVNGEQAKQEQFPYLVGLNIASKIPFQDSWCGGSIISDEWILTAAHCIKLLQGKITVSYGSENKNNAKLLTVEEKYIYRHPKFRKIFHNNFRHDIALIHTPKMKFNDKIQSIPLPSPLNGKRWTKPGTSVIAAGWGSAVLNGNVVDRLNWVKLEILDVSKCEREYGNVEGKLCVSTDKKKSVCSGDSGGPLVPEDENKLIGITSFVSSTGCDSGKPVAFTNVIDYLDWIESVSGVKP